MTKGARISARGLAKELLRRVFGHRWLVSLGARTPPALRTPLLTRMLSLLASRACPSGTLDTNLGIASRYHCAIPCDQPILLFGTPDQHVQERGALRLAACLARASDAFIDIGSHLGYFVFYLRDRLPGNIPIYYFEPDEDLFSLTQGNVSGNALANVHGFREAVGESEGSAEFFRNLSDSTSGSLTSDFSGRHAVEKVTVPVTTFDRFGSRHEFRAACVKVDIEGAEDRFLSGARQSLHRIPYLIMEVLGPATGSGFVGRMIQDGGYHAYYINDMTLERSAGGAFRYAEGQFNWLFCRKSPAELEALLAGSGLALARDARAIGVGP